MPRRIRRAAPMLLVGLVWSCCSWFRATNASPVDASCPEGSREVAVGGIHYCVLTCPGVLQNRVYCGAGLNGVGDFDGARVCAIQHHEAGIIRATKYPDPLPPEVCRLLPHGCTCSPNNSLCHPREAAELGAISEGGPPPRCAATDPECGPVSFRNICLDQAGYDPAARRIPWTPEPAFESRFRDNSCRHDGDCISSGCGYACLSVVHTRYLRFFTCEAHPEIEEALEDHFCGCVNGACTWFGQ